MKKRFRVISGGQTGVDRAALDAALEAGHVVGGWCPKGRRAEDGPLPKRYRLRETPSDRYARRTQWNVRDSDATLILCCGEPEGGTAFTLECARKQQKPFYLVDLGTRTDVRSVLRWMRAHQVRTLNIAGPREGNNPGIYRSARAWLRRLFASRLRQELRNRT